MSSTTGMSPLTKSMMIATAAIKAQDQRVLLLTQNIANAQVKARPGEDAYRRQIPFFAHKKDKRLDIGLLHVKHIIHSKEEPILTYNPGDPLADENGYVKTPNISPIMEMADMREASRSHESALRAFEKVLGMLESLSSLLK